jgi:hypothetical protein
MSPFTVTESAGESAGESVAARTSDRTAFTLPADPQLLVAEYIACILNGRPYPNAARRAAEAPGACPATVQEGIARILRGPLAS